jgi:hypothetical protein
VEPAIAKAAALMCQLKQLLPERAVIIAMD